MESSPAQIWIPCSPALPKVITTVVSPVCPVTDSVCRLRRVTTMCSTAQVSTFPWSLWYLYMLSRILIYRRPLTLITPSNDQTGIDMISLRVIFWFIFHLRHEHWHFSSSKFYAAQNALRERTNYQSDFPHLIAFWYYFFLMIEKQRAIICYFFLIEMIGAKSTEILLINSLVIPSHKNESKLCMYLKTILHFYSCIFSTPPHFFPCE